MKHALLLVLVLVTASAALVQGTFAVKPNPQNVVAARLEGVWAIHEDMTHLIGAPKDVKGFAFVRDEKVAAQIPDRFKEQIAGEIYLCGTVQIDAQTFPFVLTSENGNPRVITFRPAGEDKFGALHAFNVMLCPALERRKDMLFVGGDKNDRPFTIYNRVNLAPTKGQ
jgi:hypothetical protein